MVIVMLCAEGKGEGELIGMTVLGVVRVGGRCAQSKRGRVHGYSWTSKWAGCCCCLGGDGYKDSYSRRANLRTSSVSSHKCLLAALFCPVHK